MEAVVEMVEEPADNINNNDVIVPRRSARLALSEINDTAPVTPHKSTSPDEMIIIQRGPRRKPITWSPVEYDRLKLFGPQREKTPEKVQVKELNPKLRRRLIMSPSKDASAQDLGLAIARKLRSLKNLEKTS